MMYLEERLKEIIPDVTPEQTIRLLRLLRELEVETQKEAVKGIANKIGELAAEAALQTMTGWVRRIPPPPVSVVRPVAGIKP